MAMQHQSSQNSKQDSDVFSDFQVDGEMIVSSDLFDEDIYPSEISLFDYLMDHRHEIISVELLKRLLSFWPSQGFEWHIERGLKLTRAENPSLREQETVDKANISLLTDKKRVKIATRVQS